MKNKERRLTEVITDLCMLETNIIHNGFQGGDGGHGGYVSIQFRNISNTCMEVDGNPAEDVMLTFRGDSERIVLVKALQAILKELSEEH